MKRAGLIVGALASATCLWASSPASAFSVPCTAAVAKATTDALAVRSVWVTWATDLIARNSTKAAVDRAAATTAINVFIADITALRTACAAG